jgi:hypothetical protein
VGGWPAREPRRPAPIPIRTPALLTEVAESSTTTNQTAARTHHTTALHNVEMRAHSPIAHNQVAH